MSIFKCKMCGGTIEFEQGATVGVCDSCGTKQTLPRLDDDRRANLYDRANHFRRNNDFDKAAGLYEQILNADNTDAEAYWSLVLCRYGIEYVEDPATHKRVPTVNRTQYTSVFDDEDYKSALEHADGFQRSIYEEEAAAINEIQKGILAISQKEEPFDVFICYKEADDNGRRTVDSVLANDLYHQLTLEGFKVFYSRITLEDKLGSEYEPYIFAALNSAKVMVVLGTKPEYFNAVWVKNEWSRYLKLIKAGEKKTLIPAYRDMDPYDLPDEFSHLMAQDMSKLGFMQDLIRGIKKITADAEPKPIVKETVVVNGGAPNINPLLERAFMFLEDGDFEQADEYCERVLDQDPKNAKAYLGKLMAELRVRQQEHLKDCKEPFDGSSNYAKAIRFGDEHVAADLKGCISYINERNENERKDALYSSAKTLMTGNSIENYELAIKNFKTISGWKDADQQIYICQKRIKEMQEQERAKHLESARKAEQERIAAEKSVQKRKKMIAIVTPIIIVCVAFVILLTSVIIPKQKYKTLVARFGQEFADTFFHPNVGNVFKFGSYEQDNNTANGKEAIEWLVLAKENNKILIISKYAIDYQQYHSTYTDVTWENCSLRKWLNSTFIDSAFSEEERAMIPSVTVIADKNPNYNTNSGKSTTDQVFLLSISEANRYFTSDEERKCAQTDFVIAQGAWTSDSDTVDGRATCCWPLRTPGLDYKSHAGVNGDGTIATGGGSNAPHGEYVRNARSSIRPALWINLES